MTDFETHPKVAQLLSTLSIDKNAPLTSRFSSASLRAFKEETVQHVPAQSGEVLCSLAGVLLSFRDRGFRLIDAQLVKLFQDLGVAWELSDSEMAEHFKTSPQNMHASALQGGIQRPGGGGISFGRTFKR